MKILFTILLFAFTLTIYAQQNLVQNGSFEDTTSCPDGYYPFDNSYYWDTPNYKYYSPTIGVCAQLFHTCSSGGINVPNSPYGGGYAPAGNAYAGGYFLYYLIDTLDLKNYLQNELLNPLKPNVYYCFKMKITLGDPSKYAVNDISVYFSPTKIADSVNHVLSYLQPQITNTSGQYYTNKDTWNEYTGYFKADGGEKYMIIGSFLPTDSTPKMSLPGQFLAAYYMIDDVQLVECGDSLNTAIIENNIDSKFKLYPNPTSDNVFLELPKGINYGNIQLINSSGQLLKTLTITNHISEIDMSNYANGLYFIRIFDNSGAIIDDVKLSILK